MRNAVVEPRTCPGVGGGDGNEGFEKLCGVCPEQKRLDGVGMVVTVLSCRQLFLYTSFASKTTYCERGDLACLRQNLERTSDQVRVCVQNQRNQMLQNKPTTINVNCVACETVTLDSVRWNQFLCTKVGPD